jgi:hypothetical protein
MLDPNDGELSLACPPEWADSSMLIYSAPHDPATSTAPNVIVKRDPAPDGRSLQTHALREMTALVRALPRFELLEMAETRVSGVPALLYRFAWESPLGPIEQAFTIAETRRGDQRTFTTFLTTARKADAPLAAALFRRVLGTVRYGVPPASTRTPPPASTPIPAPPLVPMPGSVRR